LTIEACATSQFEQQVRSICGLPLGSTEFRSPAAMANLIGHLWFDKHNNLHEPDFAALRSMPDVKLHLYEKRRAAPRRKMGHLTALGATPEEARERVLRARRLLQPPA
jgi:5-(carboxyamino)imidazole ribonucleotide synthase